MEEVNIQSHGFELDEKICTHITQQLHNIFGLEKYLVRKVVVKLFEDNNLQNNINQCCHIRVEVSNQPAIITELKSLDIFTAIDLALERAMLKVSHHLNGKNAFRKRLANKKMNYYMDNLICNTHISSKIKFLFETHTIN